MKKLVVLVTALAVLWVGAPLFAADDFKPEELKKMSTFLSNFTELGFYEFETKQLAAADNLPDLIRFGVWHNYVNNFRTRVSQCPVKNCQWGSLVISGKDVAASVKKFFDLDIKPVSVTESDPPYYYDGKMYHFEGADGESVYYARVDKASKDASGNIRMTGELYNREDKADTIGTFEALAKPYTYEGKDTWAILNFKTKYHENE